MILDKIEQTINNKLRTSEHLYKICILEYCSSEKIVVLHLFYTRPIRFSYTSKFIPYNELDNYLNENKLI